jgi:Adenomatosis polyposis coli down-regulated 1
VVPFASLPSGSRMFVDIRTLLLLVVAWSLVIGAAAAGQAPAPDIRGVWEHARCQVQERDGTRTGSRSLFAIFDREWGVAFTQYADGDCRTPIMTAILRGTYEATRPSTRLPGVSEAIFRFSYKGIVAHDSALISRLNGGLCGDRQWKPGVEQDVSSTGCLSIESVTACPQEYDLVSIQGDQLFLGERPRPGENICAEARRPKRLRAVPLPRR